MEVCTTRAWVTRLFTGSVPAANTPVRSVKKNFNDSERNGHYGPHMCERAARISVANSPGSSRRDHLGSSALQYDRAAEAPVPVSQYTVMLSSTWSRVSPPDGWPSTKAREILW